MYKFIRECEEESLVNEDQIKEIEMTWSVSFPESLKDYYKNYNGCII